MSAIRLGPLDHCSILITDLANARRFYGDVLGLKEIAKPKTFDFVVIWYDLGGGQTLHLLKKPHPDSRSPRHFALAIPDAKATPCSALSSEARQSWSAVRVGFATRE